MAGNIDKDQEILDKVHVLLTRILAEFDRVCRKLGIEYAAYGGTAIGAVRHHGFIPWDDDIDVLMTRADYERFLAEAPAELGSEYRIDNLRTRDDFPFMFTKLVLKDTLLIPEFAKDSHYRLPMFIDILPVDNVPDDDAAFKKMSRSSWWWGRLVFLSDIPRPYLINITGVRRTAIYTATTTAHYLLRLFRITPRYIQSRWEKTVRKYEHVETKRMADFTMRDPETWIVRKEELFPTVDGEFDGVKVKLPKEWDLLLRRGYGDYMQIPEEKDRRNHIPYKIDFGPYDTSVN